MQEEYAMNRLPDVEIIFELNGMRKILRRMVTDRRI